MNLPVLIILFNRPDKTHTLLEALSKCHEVNEVYVACDGPRTAAESVEVENVRSTVDLYKARFRFHYNYQSDNQGCARHVSGAITWLLESREMGIILEDDCIPSSTFFEYMSSLLQLYKKDDRIGVVCGTSLYDLKREKVIDKSDDICFSRFPSVWGWGTWKRAWQDYELYPHLEPTTVLNIRNSFANKWLGDCSLDLIRRAANGNIDTWDYQLSYMLWKTNRLAILPPNNLISNVGFDASATHTIDANSKLAELSKYTGYIWGGLRDKPKTIVNNAKYELLLSKGAFLRYLKNRFARLLDL